MHENVFFSQAHCMKKQHYGPFNEYCISCFTRGLKFQKPSTLSNGTKSDQTSHAFGDKMRYLPIEHLEHLHHENQLTLALP